MKRTCNRCGAKPAPNTWHIPRRDGGGVEWDAYVLCEACYQAVCKVAARRPNGEARSLEAVAAACQPPAEGDD